MKISFEFSSIKDMLLDVPKFAQLIAGEGSSSEGIERACQDGPTPLVMKITSKNGAAFTEEEKEKIRAVIRSYVDQCIAEEIKNQLAAAKKAATAAQNVPEKAADAPEAKNEKKTDKPKREEKKPVEAPKTASNEVKDTEVRAAFAKLIKNGKRDALKEILESFGASNLPGLKPEFYAAALELAKGALE